MLHINDYYCATFPEDLILDTFQEIEEPFDFILLSPVRSF